MKRNVAEMLSSRSRTLPGQKDKWILGPTGKRLWMENVRRDRPDGRTEKSASMAMQ